jgi:DNA-binding transcriptional regulator YhcF (GntR family)
MQIADYICEKALTGQWKESERIPSVRELGITLEVNPNTAMRAYEHLEANGIIYSKRGTGYFLAEEAVAKIKTLQKEKFIAENLPGLFKNIYLLQISFDELEQQYIEYCKTNYSNS